MNYDFKDKTVLVTAASQGIGAGIALAFLKRGARVAICSRKKENTDSFASTLSPLERENFYACNGDVGDPNFPERMVTEAQKYFGSTIDILINNNGGPRPGPALSHSEQDWKSAININLLSAIRFSKQVAEGMIHKKWGRIIHLTSMTAKEPDDGMVLSSVTRAGVAAFSKTLATELGPHGVTVNTILTGGVLTKRIEELLKAGAKSSSTGLDEAIAEIAASIPVRHIASPEEFASTVLFLASPYSSYLTGVAIPLDGGYSKQMF